MGQGRLRQPAAPHVALAQPVLRLEKSRAGWAPPEDEMHNIDGRDEGIHASG